jgi:hypothetical protein
MASIMEVVICIIRKEYSTYTITSEGWHKMENNFAGYKYRNFTIKRFLPNSWGIWSTETGIDLTEFGEQYLRTTLIPNLRIHTLADNKLSYLPLYKYHRRIWYACYGGLKWERSLVVPHLEWKTETFWSDTIKIFKVKRRFLILLKKINM